MTPDPNRRWDPPSHLSISEREFLETTAQNILLIQERAALAIGGQLLAIKKRFKRDPKLGQWFTRWIKEKTCLTLNQATVWLRLAEEAEQDEKVMELVQQGLPDATLYRTCLLPKDYKEAILDSLLKGHNITAKEAADLASNPFVQVDKLEEIVFSLHSEIAQITEAQLNAKGNKRGLASSKRGAEGRLEKALTDLAKAKHEAKKLREQGESKESVISFLKREVRNKRLYIEQVTKDPDSEQRRMCAKAVVDMTQSTKALMEAFALFEAIKDQMPTEQRREVYRLIDHTYDRFKETSER